MKRFVMGMLALLMLAECVSRKGREVCLAAREVHQGA